MTISKSRVEAFSDGVIAILITIMVLELKIPHDASLDAVWALRFVFLSYVLSFIFIGIYWNNHHHMLHAVKSVNGKVLWANLHLLFWLSMVPFVTGWMGENHFSKWPVIFYGIVLIMCGVSYTILTRSLISHQGKEALLAQAVGKDWKGLASIIIYAIAIGTPFIHPFIGLGLYVFVALMWLIPDKRIEKKISLSDE